MQWREKGLEKCLESHTMYMVFEKSILRVTLHCKFRNVNCGIARSFHVVTSALQGHLCAKPACPYFDGFPLARPSGSCRAESSSFPAALEACKALDCQ